MIKIGTDICSISRITKTYERYGEKFLKRILTDAEIKYVLSNPTHTITRIAGRFAAKEAAAKALGTGWSGVGWREVEIVRQPSGEPTIVLHGRAKVVADNRNLQHWEVSISHEREFAVASVLAYSQ